MSGNGLGRGGISYDYTIMRHFRATIQCPSNRRVAFPLRAAVAPTANNDNDDGDSENTDSSSSSSSSTTVAGDMASSELSREVAAALLKCYARHLSLAKQSSVVA